VRTRTPAKAHAPAGVPFGNRCEHQQDSAVGKIGAGDDIIDPIENDGSGGGKLNFVWIGEQPTCGKRRRRSSGGRGYPTARAAGRR